VVGIFRQPSQRLLSAFRDGLHSTGFQKEDSLAMHAEVQYGTEGAEARYARYPGIAGCTARMLTGGSCAESLWARGDQPFDGGKARLKEAVLMVEKMAFVGLAERWDESICLFHRMFGGKVNTGELANYHPGRGHTDKYNESLLDGFKDKVDEEIYSAAVSRFEGLLQKYVGNSSICGSLKTSAQSLAQTDASVGTACSCASEGRECGMSKQGIHCGNCPSSRLDFIDEGKKPGAAMLRCDEEAGRCLVGGVPAPEIFAWNFTRQTNSSGRRLQPRIPK